MSGSPIPILEEFAVAESDRAAVNELIARVAAALELSDTTHRSVILAALTEITARYMQPGLQHSEPPKRRTTG
jgi:hypothetical protein